MNLLAQQMLKLFVEQTYVTNTHYKHMLLTLSVAVNSFQLLGKCRKVGSMCAVNSKRLVLFHFKIRVGN